MIYLYNFAKTEIKMLQLYVCHTVFGCHFSWQTQMKVKTPSLHSVSAGSAFSWSSAVVHLPFCFTKQTHTLHKFVKSPGYESESTCAFPTCRRHFSWQGQLSPWFHVGVLKCRVNMHLITTSLFFHMDSASVYLLCDHSYEIKKISKQLAVGQNYVWNSNKNYHHWLQEKDKLSQ